MSDLEQCSPRHTSSHQRIVWEVLYARDHFEHRDDAGNNSLPTIKTRKQEIIHIIAPTIAIAKAAAAHYYPAYASYEVISFTPLCTINHEVTL
jgi:hypothetical protein